VDSSEIDYCKRSLKALYEQRAWMDGAIEILEARLACQERSEKTGSEVLEVEPAWGGGSYVLQKVRCGKNTCHCAKAGGELHGPYWYLYFKKDGRTRSKYIGKSKPVEV
jgi:hypothetical protein